MREAREHDMLETRELVGEGGIDSCVAMAEEIDPPRAHGVEVAAALEIVKPATAGARDGHEGQRFMLLHLGARMPYGGAAALQQQIVASASLHTA